MLQPTHSEESPDRPDHIAVNECPLGLQSATANFRWSLHTTETVSGSAAENNALSGSAHGNKIVTDDLSGGTHGTATTPGHTQDGADHAGRRGIVPAGDCIGLAIRADANPRRGDGVRQSRVAGVASSANALILESIRREMAEVYAERPRFYREFRRYLLARVRYARHVMPECVA